MVHVPVLVGKVVCEQEESARNVSSFCFRQGPDAEESDDAQIRNRGWEYPESASPVELRERDTSRAFSFNEELGAYQVAANSKEHSHPEEPKVLRCAAASGTMAEQYQTDGDRPPSIQCRDVVF